MKNIVTHVHQVKVENKRIATEMGVDLEGGDNPDKQQLDMQLEEVLC